VLFLEFFKAFLSLPELFIVPSELFFRSSALFYDFVYASFYFFYGFSPESRSFGSLESTMIFIVPYKESIIKHVIAS